MEMDGVYVSLLLSRYCAVQVLGGGWMDGPLLGLDQKQWGGESERPDRGLQQTEYRFQLSERFVGPVSGGKSGLDWEVRA